MRTVPACAAIGSLTLCAVAAADVYVFDNALTYAAFCNDSGVVRQTQDLSAFAGTYSVVSGGAGDFAWSLAAPNGLFANPSGIRTQVNSDKLTLNLVSSNVFAVGGDFFNMDSVGATQAGTMKIRLADGTTFIRAISNNTTFSGFVSDGANIASVEISHAGNFGSQYFVATDGFSVGVIPAPGALAVLGVAGLTARRRRR